MSSNVIEIFGFVTGFLAIILSIRQYIWTWLFDVITNILFIRIFWQAGQYVDVVFRSLFILLALYGWYVWVYQKKNTNEMQVSRLGLKKLSLLGTVGVINAIILWLFLRPGGTPLFDVIAVVLVIMSQYLLAKKYLESWYVLLVSDILLIGVYFDWKLYFFSLLSTATFIMCLIGLQQWRKALQGVKSKLIA